MTPCLEFIGLAVLGALVGGALYRAAQRNADGYTESERRYFKRHAIDYERKERK